MIKRNNLRNGLLIVLSAAVLSACGNGSQASTADYIGIDAAKEAALKDAGLTSQEADFSAAGLDSKNGTFYYQVIFTANGEEQEYDIDAVTGVVIEKKTLSGAENAQETTAALAASSAQDPSSSEAGQEAAAGSAAAEAAETAEAAPEAAAAASSSAQTPSAEASLPSSEIEPLSIALAHAGLTQDQVSRSRIEEDFDDGLHIYEVEFFSADGVEYSYDIKADDGTILSFDQDAEYLLPPSSQDAGMVSEDQAKQSVIERVPGAAAEDVSVLLKRDDGRMEYEGRLIYDNMLYEFKIDAYSGLIVEWEAENLNFYR